MTPPPDADWRHRWGDEYSWTRLLPIAWAAIDVPAMHDLVAREARVPSRRGSGGASALEHTPRWSAVLHLLVFGMGWTDLYAGVDRWRQQRFAAGHHPVLDLVGRMLGEDIDALPVYLARWNTRLGGEIARRLGAPGYADTLEVTRVSWSDDPDTPSEPSLSAGGRALLEGGTDPLHLVSHFELSLSAEGDDRPRWTRMDAGHHALRLSRYAGWARLLAGLDLGAPREDGTRGGAVVAVEVDGVGSLGWYHGPGPESGGCGRWFRFSEMYGDARSQYESHAWGN